MERFTNIEYADIHFCYGEAEGISRRARQIYIQRFPDRRIPNARTFATIHRNLRENGRFRPANAAVGGRAPVQNMARIEDAVLRRIEENSSVSTRQLGDEFNISHMAVWNMIHRNGLYPYHLQRVQALTDGDFVRRLEFCHWYQNQNQHGDLAARIIFTDESQFTRDGINNFHNQHIYSADNPHAIRETNFQERFSLNVWGGLYNDQLLGPHFLPDRLDGALYRRFLLDEFPEIIEFENIPPAVRRNIWFMHDGAPPHYAGVAKAVLQQNILLSWPCHRKTGKCCLGTCRKYRMATSFT